MNNSMNNKVGRGAMVGALLTIAFCGPLHAGSDDTCGATRGPVRFSGLISGGDVLPPLAVGPLMGPGCPAGSPVRPTQPPSGTRSEGFLAV